MNIIILLFIISSIIIFICLKKLSMLIAGKIYVLCAYVVLLLYSFITDSIIISNIIKLFIPTHIYDYIYSALNNNDYVFTYIAILSFITIVQVLISYFILQKRILSSDFKLSSERIKVEVYSNEKSLLKKEKVNKKNIHLNKVYIDLCRMMN